MFALLFLVASLCMNAARAQDRGSAPPRLDVSLSGSSITGNLTQAQVQGQLRLSDSGARAGYDAVGTAFRLWIVPAPGLPYLRVGDDLAAMALPFYYVGDKTYVLGVARAERSQLRGVNSRLNAGAGFGVAPVRKTDKLVRVALGGQVERTDFATTPIEPGFAEGGDPRVVPRVVVQSNGWFRVPRSKVSGRFVGSALVNPVEPRDWRALLDASGDLKVAGPLSVRASGILSHDAVHSAGVQPTDLRATLGLAWSAPAPKGD
jgi:hypothetical protein